MQPHRVPAGSTSVIIPVEVWDASSAVGAKLAGLAYNTASLTAHYNRVGAAGAATAITLATATKGTWTSGGFVAVDGTNTPGLYELHVPDAAFAVGSKACDIVLKGAANMVPVVLHVELETVTNDVAAVHVHAQTIIDNLAVVDGIVDNIHDVDLPAVAGYLDTEIAAILAALASSDSALILKVLSNKTVPTLDENGNVTAVTLYDDDDTTPLGTWTWDAATKTRGRLT